MTKKTDKPIRDKDQAGDGGSGTEQRPPPPPKWVVVFIIVVVIATAWAVASVAP